MPLSSYSSQPLSPALLLCFRRHCWLMGWNSLLECGGRGHSVLPWGFWLSWYSLFSFVPSLITCTACSHLHPHCKSLAPRRVIPIITRVSALGWGAECLLSVEPVKPLNRCGVTHVDIRYCDLWHETDGDRIFLSFTVLISHVQISHLLHANQLFQPASRLTRLTRGLCCSPRTQIILFLSFLIDVAAALRMGATPHPAGLSRVERSPVTKHRELPTISVSKSASSSNKSETAHLTPKSDTHLSPHKSSPTHEVLLQLPPLDTNFSWDFMV